jgi:hypothetical protein
VQARFYRFTFTRDCIKGISVVLDFKTFGPRESYSAQWRSPLFLILWAGSPIDADEGAPEESRVQEAKNKRERILKKNL